MFPLLAPPSDVGRRHQDAVVKSKHQMPNPAADLSVIS